MEHLWIHCSQMQHHPDANVSLNWVNLKQTKAVLSANAANSYFHYQLIWLLFPWLTNYMFFCIKCQKIVKTMPMMSPRWYLQITKMLNIQFTITLKQGKNSKSVLTLQKLEELNICLFCLEKWLKRLIDYLNICRLTHQLIVISSNVNENGTFKQASV